MAIRPLKKPAKGSALLLRRINRKAVVAHEKKEMRAALVRDGHQCRFPRCEVRGLPIDPCHLQHRGMGGNPKGDRTERKTVIALCRIHHGWYDQGELDIEPLTPELFDGPCDWYVFSTVEYPIRRLHWATESRIGISETRGVGSRR